MKPTCLTMLRVLPLLAVLPAAAPAVDCGPDCLGLYFEPSAETWCLPGATVGTYTGYLVLSGPSMDAVVAMSIAFVLDGPVAVTGVNFGSPVICEPSEPGAYCTAWSPPLATTGPTLLATVQFFYSGMGAPALIGLRNAGAPVDDRPWVVVPGDVAVPLNPLAGPGEPMAQFGGECQIVPTDGTAWGAVKGLYR